MAAYKESKRREARLLRRANWSLRRIAAELDVALSTVSIWVRDIPRIPEPDFDKKEPCSPRPRRLDDDAPPETGSKACGRCKEELPLAAFNRYRNGRQAWCRECFRLYFKERGKLHLLQVARTKPARMRRVRRYVGEYLSSHPCSGCGESDISVLDFHHLGDKTAEITRMVNSGLRDKARRR
jgi:hypothetical protein